MSAHAPMVTVTMTAFEHARWIAQALDGILKQTTTFEFDIVVGEDCSSDHTRQVLRTIAELKPDRFQLILPDQNMGHGGNALYGEVMRRARGKYWAFLDGDDYWTDPEKLEKQVAVMEADSSLAICCHQASVLLPDGLLAAQPYTSAVQPRRSTGRDLCRDNFIPSCSALLRADALRALPQDWVSARFGDWLLYLCASRHGAIEFIPESMGVYRSHGRGVWSKLSRREQLEATIGFLADTRSWLPELAPDLHIGRLSRLVELATICSLEGDFVACRSLLRQVESDAPADISCLAIKYLQHLGE